MTSYKIELQSRRNVRLIKNDGKGSVGMFDGGSIHYAPESYPATIHRHNDEPVLVSNETDWASLASAYVRGDA